MSDKIPIAEAIRELRVQLTEAMTQGENERVRFVSKGVELELAVSFSREGGGGGKVNIFTVVEVSGAAKVTEQTTHKVKLVLEPVQPVAPRRPDSGPAVAPAGRSDTPPALSGGVHAVSHRTVEALGVDLSQHWEPVILQLPADAEAWAGAVDQGALGRLVQNAVAEGGSTGAALQQGAIDFAATGHALNSMLQEASRSPGDPRYQNFTSLLFENMAKQDAARMDQGSEESA